MQPTAVAASRYIADVEARLIGARLGELGRDQDVLARLVPEVVVEPRSRAAVLPATLHLEGPGVENGETAGASAVVIAKHADHDVASRHAVHGVGTGVAGLPGQ